MFLKILMHHVCFVCIVDIIGLSWGRGEWGGGLAPLPGFTEGSQSAGRNAQKTMKEERLPPAELLTLGIWLGQSLSGN